MGSRLTLPNRSATQSELHSLSSITMPITSRELLSKHVCVATFSGVEAGREPMLRIYPPQPAKQWATFAIESYEEYEKPGKYGDEKTEKFAFVPDEQPDWAELVASLAAGDRVKIAWLHEYVTREEPGEGDNEGKTFTSKYPERIVTQLEKL